MKRRSFVLLGASLLAWGPARAFAQGRPLAKKPAEPTTAIVGATVMTGTGETIENATVVFAGPTIVSVGQVMQAANAKDDDNKRKSSFLGSQIVPSPGAQVVIWNVNDPDGDNVRCTFAIRRDGEEKWTDVALNTRDTFVQFDTSALAD